MIALRLAGILVGFTAFFIAIGLLFNDRARWVIMIIFFVVFSFIAGAASLFVN